MKNNILNDNCISFIDDLASSKPVPGGGSASALVGAVGAALGAMVGSLTVGKKTYADVEEDMQALLVRSKDVIRRLEQFAQADVEAFRPLAEAYGLPNSTPEEKAHREAVMAQVLLGATKAPLDIVRACSEAIELCEEFAHKGSRLALSDAGVGVTFCKAAMQGAALNVFINTKAMKSRSDATILNEETDRLLSEYVPRADAVYEYVTAELRKGNE